MECAFGKAGERAAESKNAPEVLAADIVDLCSTRKDVPPPSDSMRMRMRAAALAMIARKRGLDGQPADAPFRIPVLTTVRAETGMRIPDEIAPAIIPYIRCLVTSEGLPMYTEGRKQLIPPPSGVAKGSNCADFRVRARSDAEMLLRRQGKGGKAEREKLIDDTLGQADNFFRSTATPPGRSAKRGPVSR
jgi:hypothetical protein